MRGDFRLSLSQSAYLTSPDALIIWPRPQRYMFHDRNFRIKNHIMMHYQFFLILDSKHWLFIYSCAFSWHCLKQISISSFSFMFFSFFMHHCCLSFACWLGPTLRTPLLGVPATYYCMSSKCSPYRTVIKTPDVLLTNQPSTTIATELRVTSKDFFKMQESRM